jgi:hypothetical protein
VVSDVEAAWTWLQTVVEGLTPEGLGQLYGVLHEITPHLAEETAAAGDALGEVAVTTLAQRAGLPAEHFRRIFALTAEALDHDAPDAGDPHG